MQRAINRGKKEGQKRLFHFLRIDEKEAVREDSSGM
jgi:hypothetical protein